MLGWFRKRSAKRSNHPTVYVCTAPKLRKVAKNEDEDGEYAIKTMCGSQNIKYKLSGPSHPTEVS